VLLISGTIREQQDGLADLVASAGRSGSIGSLSRAADGDDRMGQPTGDAKGAAAGWEGRGAGLSEAGKAESSLALVEENTPGRPFAVSGELFDDESSRDGEAVQSVEDAAAPTEGAEVVEEEMGERGGGGGGLERQAGLVRGSEPVVEFGELEVSAANEEARASFEEEVYESFEQVLFDLEVPREGLNDNVPTVEEEARAPFEDEVYESFEQVLFDLEVPRSFDEEFEPEKRAGERARAEESEDRLDSVDMPERDEERDTELVEGDAIIGGLEEEAGLEEDGWQVDFPDGKPGEVTFTAEQLTAMRNAEDDDDSTPGGGDPKAEK
jgi:hypothetical protein